jgi:hypothetical protein
MYEYMYMLRLACIFVLCTLFMINVWCGMHICVPARMYKYKYSFKDRNHE